MAILIWPFTFTPCSLNKPPTEFNPLPCFIKCPCPGSSNFLLVKIFLISYPQPLPPIHHLLWIKVIRRGTLLCDSDQVQSMIVPYVMLPPQHPYCIFCVCLLSLFSSDKIYEHTTSIHGHLTTLISQKLHFSVKLGPEMNPVCYEMDLRRLRGVQSYDLSWSAVLQHRFMVV